MLCSGARYNVNYINLAHSNHRLSNRGHPSVVIHTVANTSIVILLVLLCWYYHHYYWLLDSSSTQTLQFLIPPLQLQILVLEIFNDFL